MSVLVIILNLFFCYSVIIGVNYWFFFFFVLGGIVFGFFDVVLMVVINLFKVFWIFKSLLWCFFNLGCFC